MNKFADLFSKYNNELLVKTQMKVDDGGNNVPDDGIVIEVSAFAAIWCQRPLCTLSHAVERRYILSVWQSNSDSAVFHVLQCITDHCIGLMISSLRNHSLSLQRNRFNPMTMFHYAMRCHPVTALIMLTILQ